MDYFIQANTSSMSEVIGPVLFGFLLIAVACNGIHSAWQKLRYCNGIMQCIYAIFILLALVMLVAGVVLLRVVLSGDAMTILGFMAMFVVGIGYFKNRRGYYPSVL